MDALAEVPLVAFPEKFKNENPEGCTIYAGMLSLIYAKVSATDPRVVAVKDATGNVGAAKERIARTGLAWYSGDDPLTLDFLRAGAVGVVSVSSHIASREIAAMIAAFEAGDVAEAERIHEALLPVHAAVFNGPGATNAKSAMYWAGVIPSRAMRLPLLPASDAEYGALTAALEAAGMTR